MYAVVRSITTTIRTQAYAGASTSRQLHDTVVNTRNVISTPIKTQQCMHCSSYSIHYGYSKKRSCTYVRSCTRANVDAHIHVRT